MNYNKNNFAYVVNWQDMNQKNHQDEIVRIGLYDSTSGRSWVHDWNDINDGLSRFLKDLPKLNTVVYKLRESSLALLRADYIVIPESKLIQFAVEITKVI